MELTIIISICSLLILAYLFDLTSSRTKIPSVILLLLLGWLVRQLTGLMEFQLPDFSPILPILGTIGLILIVLEGSLELELNKSKVSLIVKSLLGAFIPILVLSFSLAYCFQYFGGNSLKENLINAIPFCVISSAIAIPTVKYFKPKDKEFVIYESSLSDILGVIFFNFIALNNNLSTLSFGVFALQLLSMVVISFIATIGLSLLLSKLQHNIKFVPIIILIILIYAVSKTFHLPALIFILFFGLFISNLDELKRFKWIEKFRPDILNKEVMKFKELIIEATFLIRALFFLLFGYLIETSDILNLESSLWAVGIVTGIFIIRIVQLKLSKLPLLPLLFVAPRGLITILLFLSIAEFQRIPLVNKSLVIQVILLTTIVMMFGLMGVKSVKPKVLDEEVE